MIRFRGYLLKQLRKSLKLSKKAFIVYLAQSGYNISPRMLMDYESCRTVPSLVDLTKLVKATGKTLKDFCGE